MRFHRIVKIKPAVVRAGQLVEAQVGFSAISNGTTKAVFLRRLYSLCIIDRTYQIVSLHCIVTT